VCETWSLTLREKRRLSVFENTVLRRIFWPERSEVTGEWRKLHSVEQNDLHSITNIVRVVKSCIWHGACGVDGEERGVHRLLVGKLVV
jgi:hypothetical protein